MHPDSEALSEEPVIWLFIYPQSSFEDSPLGINLDSLHQGLNLLSPRDGVCDQW